MEQRGIIVNIQKFSIHDGPGIRTTVFLKGCPLRCPWCANPESQKLEIQQGSDGTVYGRQMAVEEVVAEVLQDRDFYEESGGGVTLSGGEPLLQYAFARALLRAFKAEGIHTAVETTGAIRPERFAEAIEYVDLLLFDVKHYDACRHEKATGLSNETILRNLRHALEIGKDLLVRIPLIPGFNDSPDDARGFSTLFASLGVRRAELLPFHQFGEKKYALLGMEYAYADQPALREERLAAYKEVFCAHGIAPVQ